MYLVLVNLKHIASLREMLNSKDSIAPRDILNTVINKLELKSRSVNDSLIDFFLTLKIDELILCWQTNAIALSFK